MSSEMDKFTEDIKLFYQKEQNSKLQSLQT